MIFVIAHWLLVLITTQMTEKYSTAMCLRTPGHKLAALGRFIMAKIILLCLIFPKLQSCISIVLSGCRSLALLSDKVADLWKQPPPRILQPLLFTILVPFVSTCFWDPVTCVHIYAGNKAISYLTLGCSIYKTDVGEYASTAWRSFCGQSRFKCTHSFDVKYYNNSEFILSKIVDHRNEIRDDLL